MTNTYDMLLNPPVKKPQQSEKKTIDANGQGNQQISKPVRKTNRPVPTQASKPLLNKEKKAKIPDINSVNQPINQSVNQLINRQTNQLMNKPTGFYISEQLDVRLDQAVEYFRRKHGLKKVDRSIVINALLEKEELWEEPFLDQLIEGLIRLLTHRLMR